MSHAAFSSGRGRHVPIKNQVFLAACTQGQEDKSDLKKRKLILNECGCSGFFYLFILNL